MKKNVKIPFARIPITGKELEYVREVFESGWLTTAKKAALFEKVFAEYLGVKYACAVNSCTAALHLGIKALGVKPGEKVFVQSMTFTATAEVIRYVGAHPVFLDTEYGSNLITPDILEKAIKNHPDVKYIIIVHFGGHPARMISEKKTGILNICRNHKIRILEDAAHALPSKLNGHLVGSFGDVTCFSFYANKTITTGEGGMLVTDDRQIYEHVKVMRLHGINKDIWDRFYSDKPKWEYDVVEAGFKYNMPDINAAIGLAQFEQLEVFRSERQKVAEFYFDNLGMVKEIDLPVLDVAPEDHSWHLFPVVLNDNARIGRNELIDKMSAAGIGTSVHYKPLHRMTYYKNKYHLSPDDYPNAERTWKGNVSLPIYPYLKTDELRYICKTLRELLKQ
ncbi:MAG TPA: DegT/DnrJ/EryC1/StrS family aminotransferase [Bacteroidales bacterium]|jgi:dTDP-4-amino-4,6-dideoxygalactose transaminase|nr:DegT/DnrJ/EryC1/StrS family aminotransferase [Bacteroidales bacterium]